MNESWRQTGGVSENGMEGKLLAGGWPGEDVFSIKKKKKKINIVSLKNTKFNSGLAEDKCVCSPSPIHKCVKTTAAVNRL